MSFSIITYMLNIRRFILRAKFQIQLFTQPMETIRYAHTHTFIDISNKKQNKNSSENILQTIAVFDGIEMKNFQRYSIDLQVAT